MCTASHNPKRIHRRQAGRRGRARAVGRRRDRATCATEIDAGLGDPPGGGSVQEVSILSEFQEAALGLHRRRPDSAAEGRRRRWQRDGRTDGRPAAAAPRARPRRDLLEPDGEFPDHEPNPLLPENREFIMREVVRQGADLGIAWDGDADRCFFIDERGAFVDGDFLTALLAELDARQGARRDDPLRRARQPGGRRHRARGRRPGARSTASATRSSRRGCARSTRVFGGEVSGHYYFRDFYCADSGTIPALLILELLSQRRRAHVRAARALPLVATSSPARSTARSPTRPQSSRSSPTATATGASTRLDGVSVDYDDWHFNVRPSNTEPLLRLCVESLRSREDMERPPRRAAERDPLVTEVDRPDVRSPTAGGARAAEQDGIHTIALPTPFLVGRVNCYLIEDRPLTLVDTGPNSGKSLDELERALDGLGHTIEDLELIVITHQHMDHLGLLEILARRSGADVAALDLLEPYLTQLQRQRRCGRRVRDGRHAPSRGARRPGNRAQLRRRVVQGVRLERTRHAPAPRRRRPRARRQDPARPAPPGPQPLRHRVLGSTAADVDRWRPSDRPHLVQPADLQTAHRARAIGGRAP